MASGSEASGAADTKECSHDTAQTEINQPESSTTSQSQDSSTSKQSEADTCSHGTPDSQSERGLVSHGAPESQSEPGIVSCDTDSPSLESKSTDSASKTDSVPIEKGDSLTS